MHRQNLGEMLLAANLIDEVQMQVALAEQKRTGKRFGSTLVELKFIDENVLAAFLSRQLDVPCISLHHIDIPRKVLRKFSRETATEMRAIPVRIEGGQIEVAMVDPSDSATLAKVEALAGMPVIPLIAPQSSIEAMIDRFFPPAEEDDTISVKQPQPRNAPTDPAFWEIIADLDAGDIDERLTRIEQNLDRIWVLLEKVLRVLELREVIRHQER